MMIITNNKIFGFSLIEMLISLSLSIFLIGLLIKIYCWHEQIQHKIEDMVYLDHQGVIAMVILANALRSEKIINTENNRIILSQKIFYIKKPDKNLTGLYYIKNKKNLKNSVEIISGVKNLEAKLVNKNLMKINIDIIAPHGMSEKFSEKISDIDS